MPVCCNQSEAAPDTTETDITDMTTSDGGGKAGTSWVGQVVISSLTLQTLQDLSYQFSYDP